VEAQAFADAHSAPAVQSMQAPALQTWFGPQVLPFATGAPSVQAGRPVPQVTVPLRHGLAGVQAEPAAQETH
jgi:hypothetical protein